MTTTAVTTSVPESGVVTTTPVEVKSVKPATAVSAAKDQKRAPSTGLLQKYRRIEKPREPTPDDEIRVMGNGRVMRYVAYAAKLFNEMNMKGITIRATGKAVAIAVSVCEVIKRRFKGLHQETTIGSTEITDEYEPLEAGLEHRVEKRNVPCISILLTTDETKVNKEAIGYQAPLDESLVFDSPVAFANLENKPRRANNRQRRTNNKPNGQSVDERNGDVTKKPTTPVRRGPRRMVKRVQKSPQA